jgi:hypothetical protein
MKNIEKYKNEIMNGSHADLACDINVNVMKLPCSSNCKECKKSVVKWLLEEYSEPILNDAERKYLSAIIKPFKNKVTGITKVKDEYNENMRYIRIKVRSVGTEYINLPWFEANTMYKGMKENREYTLEELGL